MKLDPLKYHKIKTIASNVTIFVWEVIIYQLNIYLRVDLKSTVSRSF